MASERRHATLVAFVIEKQAAITDLAIDMFCKLIGSTRRRAEISQKERRLKAAEVLEVVAQDHIKLGRALTAARDGNTDIESVITASLGWEGLIASMEAAASVASSHHCSERDELIGRQKSLRKLGRLIFRAFRPDDSVLWRLGICRRSIMAENYPNKFRSILYPINGDVVSSMEKIPICRRGKSPYSFICGNA